MIERRIEDRRKENRRKQQILIWSWEEKRYAARGRFFPNSTVNDNGRRMTHRRKVEIIK